MIVLVDDRSTGDLVLSDQRHAEQTDTHNIPLVTALKHGLDGFGVKGPGLTTRPSCAAHRPISTRLEPASRLRSFHH